MEETIICKICLEPIFNYICVNCLEGSIEKWLRSFEPSMLEEFRKFSKSFKENFESSFEKEKCIKCKLKTETITCPYCYSREVFDFLLNKSERIAKNFVKIFNFDFLGNGYNSQIISTNNWQPIIIADTYEDQDLNICENCGNQSDYLRNVNGSYICEGCEDERS